MSPRFLPLVALVLTLVFGSTALTSPTGDLLTYLPVVYQEQDSLPQGNLLLYTVGYQAEANIFLSSPPPASSIQLTTAIGSTNPRFSPDGQYILYSADYSAEGTRLWVMGANGEPNFPLIEVVDEYALGVVRWGPDSQTLAYRYSDGASTLQVISIDNPTPTIIANEPSTTPLWDNTQMRLYYTKVTSNGVTEEIRRINADGTNDTLVTTTEGEIVLYTQLAGGQLLFRVYTNTIDDLYLVNPDGTNLIQLTNEPEYEARLSASPRGDNIFFQRENDLYLIDITGATVWSRSMYCPDSCRLARTSWSPDGEEVAFTFSTQIDNTTSHAIYQIPSDGSQAEPTLFYDDSSPAHGYSPDGRYFAYEAAGEILVLDRTTHTTNTIRSSDNEVYFYEWRPLP